MTENLQEAALDKAASIYLITRLNKNFIKWDAYKLGLIDDKGNVLKTPETKAERQAFGILDKIVLKIRKNLPRSVLSALSIYSVYKILAEDDRESSWKQLNETMLPLYLKIMTEASEQGIDEIDALRWLIDKLEVEDI